MGKKEVEAVDDEDQGVEDDHQLQLVTIPHGVVRIRSIEADARSPAYSASLARGQ